MGKEDILVTIVTPSYNQGQFIEDTIKMFETINSEADCTKVIEDFLSTASKYDVNAEDLSEVKQILHQFTDTLYFCGV